MLVFSFCKPSRGPTSTIRTWSAAALAENEKARAGARWRLRRQRRERDVGTAISLCVNFDPCAFSQDNAHIGGCHATETTNDRMDVGTKWSVLIEEAKSLTGVYRK